MIETIKSAKAGKDRGQRRRMRLFVVVLVLFFGWAIVTVIKQQWILYQEKKDFKLIQQQLVEVKKQNKDYKAQLLKLNDKEYLEQLLRSKLYMTKNNEQLFLEGQ
jgi:cell division protein DivIC